MCAISTLDTKEPERYLKVALKRTRFSLADIFFNVADISS